ncbi:MAG: undecaprenyldiphospho-muramoylpentapeptide beta-N-acetylglucosaminyltransferase [Gammaproteobacteria bacterium]|jgi:UDP-N-acetylglucosamine--N-acetylmuramyl-(pentapeptide) pyrophosphoryl-undecaprenol N-acetylglucosamine transferase
MSDNANKKILIMAGGTGGHVFPALSIAEYLQSQGVQVEWLGTRQGLEATVIPKTSIPLHYISVSGLRGSSLGRKLLAPFVLTAAVMQSLFKVMQVKPGCVLGMGGFVSGPGGLAAWLLRKKLLIHEQNAIAGLTNQLLFPLASTVMEAFPGAFARKKALSSNSFMKGLIKADSTIVVGNPVRQDIVDLPEDVNSRNERLRILVIGGSLGAVAINRAVPAMLALMNAEERPEIRHQCGSRNLEETRAVYEENGIALTDAISVQAFIDDMASAYQWADLIIARAGAMTVSEIAAAGLASILIPYPYAVDDHQTENAGYLLRAGAAEVIQQEDLTPDSLLAAVRKFSLDANYLEQASKQSRQAGSPDATETVANICLEVCHA